MANNADQTKPSNVDSIDFTIEPPIKDPVTDTQPTTEPHIVPPTESTPKADEPQPPTPKDETGNTPTENVPQVDTFEKDDIVNISGVDYVIDENGNVTNEDGTIFKTKDEFDILLREQVSNADNTSTSIDDNIKRLIELTGTDVQIDGDVPTFTPDFIAKREAEIIKDTTIKAKDEAIKEYFDANPDLASIASHKDRFGTLDNYGRTMDYSTMDVTKFEPQDLTNVIIEAEMQKGATIDRATRIANMSKTENTLEADAKDSLEYLQTKQNEEIAQYNAAVTTQRNAAIQELNHELGASFDDKGVTILNVPDSLYDNVVNKGSLGNIKIPTNGIVINTGTGRKQLSRNELFSYLAKPIQEIEGVIYSQAELDLIDKLKDRNYRSLYAIYAINGFDSLVKEKANENKVIIVKKNLSTSPKSTATNDRASSLPEGRKIVF